MTSQISYVHGSSLTSLIGETIGAHFDRIAATYPERDAMIVRHQDVRWTYSEFADRVDRLARGLIASGLQPGDRMGIWSPNCAEWLLAQYASAKAGVVLVNVNPAYRTSELEYVLNQSGCRMLVSASAFKSSDYAAMVDEVAPQCPGLEQVVFLDSPEWEQLSAGEEDVSLPAGLQFDDPINIQYTSGTTGFPKGATLTHHNILNNGFFIGE
ncbi:MAG: AMP-binding protein, partial [Solirubrobacteraceae bacterium]